MKKLNPKLALTILMVSLLKSVYSQDINPWDIKISSEKDIDSSKIEVMTNGVKLKKDSSGRFIYQQITTDFEPALLYKKIDLEFKINLLHTKENDTSLVHPYYIKDKNALLNDIDNDIRGCQHPRIYPYLYPEFIPSNDYPTFNDYIISEIKASKIIAVENLFIQVIVTKDGSLKYEKIVKGNINSEDLNKIIKILNNSPRWIPGDINGNKVDIRKVVSIKFN
jgi:hypothetical protein